MPPTNNPQVPDPASYPESQPRQPGGNLPNVPQQPPYTPGQQPAPQNQQPGQFPPQLQPIQQQPQPYQVAHPTQAPQYPAAQSAATPTSGRYDFFLDPDKPKKAPVSGVDAGFKKILILAGGFIAVLIFAAIVLTASRSNNDAAITLSYLITTQQNIINTSDTAKTSLNSTSLVNFATTAKVSTKSDQNKMIAYVASRGIKTDPKTLQAFSDPKVDEALKAAAAAGTYDATFRKTMQTMLTDYAANLKKIHDLSTVESERDITKKDSEAVTLLLRMLGQQ